MVDAPPVPTLAEPLTDREGEVAQLVATGMSDNAIAKQLNLSRNTIKTLLSRIYGKLGISGDELIVQRKRSYNARVLLTRWVLTQTTV